MISLFLLVMSAQVPGSLAAEMSPSDFFEAGTAARQNSREARPLFSQAARGFDQAWNAHPETPFPRSPQLALARSRSHYLAGNLPRALAAVHEGLELAPFDLELQKDLYALRGTIAYPESVDASTRVRPDDPRALRHRVSPWDAFFAAGLFGLAAGAGVVSQLTARPRWAWFVTGIGLIGMTASAWAAWRISHTEPRPLLILTADTALRRGNGVSFPPRMAEALPKGAELFEIGRRGGWVQVELAGGATGWLPESFVLKVTVNRTAGAV